MEFPLYLDYLGLAAVGVVLLFVFFDFDPRNVRYKGVWFRRRLLRAAVDRAKKLGPLFTSKMVGSVAALATPDDFHRGLAEHGWLVEKGEIQAWQRILSFAVPTFTFCSRPEDMCSAHTGDDKDGDWLLKQVIRAATGLNTNLFDTDELRAISNAMITYDPRLFVPYAGSTIKPQEWQFARYGKTDLSQAEAYFLDYVKRKTAVGN